LPINTAPIFASLLLSVWIRGNAVSSFIWSISSTKEKYAMEKDVSSMCDHLGDVPTEEEAPIASLPSSLHQVWRYVPPLTALAAAFVLPELGAIPGIDESLPPGGGGGWFDKK
jgi:hypothetical protein